MKKITIATWNVNSVRARLPSIERYIEEKQPDILLLQEIKCSDHDFPLPSLLDHFKYISICGQKAYNGVAVLSRMPISSEKPVYFAECNDEARYLECKIDIGGAYAHTDIDVNAGVHIDDRTNACNYNHADADTATDVSENNRTSHSLSLHVGSIYVPNGTAINNPRFAVKLRYLREFNEYIKNQIVDNRKYFIIGGDYNVAPYDCDVADFDDFDGTLGFHPKERDMMMEILNDGEILDLYRHIIPSDNCFSWWDYKDRNSFAKNYGMRIDALLASKNVAKILHEVKIDKETRSWDRPSDHCPVRCILNL